jgi:hypothetical protein
MEYISLPCFKKHGFVMIFHLGDAAIAADFIDEMRKKCYL